MVDILKLRGHKDHRKHRKAPDHTHEDFFLVEPDLPIIDCHHHFWDLKRDDRIIAKVNKATHWMKIGVRDKLVRRMSPGVVEFFGPGKESGISSTYLPVNLAADFGGHHVLQTVHIEAKWNPKFPQPVKESEMAQRCYDQPADDALAGMAAGIVAGADLSLGQKIDPLLALHAKVPNVRGIRSSVSWSSDKAILNFATGPGVMTSKKFKEGFALLSKYNFSYDVFCYFDQLPEVHELATAFPDTPIILDHSGTPIGIGKYGTRKEQVLEQWKTNMKQVASCPNVVLKLSGLGMPVTNILANFQDRVGQAASEELASIFKPYILFCIETFGVDRCMFASNFPVDRANVHYATLFNAFKLVVSDFSQEDKLKLFHDNASRVYRLDQQKKNTRQLTRPEAMEIAQHVAQEELKTHAQAELMRRVSTRIQRNQNAATEEIIKPSNLEADPEPEPSPSVHASEADGATAGPSGVDVVVTDEAGASVDVEGVESHE